MQRPFLGAIAGNHSFMLGATIPAEPLNNAVSTCREVLGMVLLFVLLAIIPRR